MCMCNQCFILIYKSTIECLSHVHLSICCTNGRSWLWRLLHEHGPHYVHQLCLCVHVCVWVTQQNPLYSSPCSVLDVSGSMMWPMATGDGASTTKLAVAKQCLSTLCDQLKTRLVWPFSYLVTKDIIIMFVTYCECKGLKCADQRNFTAILKFVYTYCHSNALVWFWGSEHFPFVPLSVTPLVWWDSMMLQKSIVRWLLGNKWVHFTHTLHCSTQLLLGTVDVLLNWWFLCLQKLPECDALLLYNYIYTCVRVCAFVYWNELEFIDLVDMGGGGALPPCSALWVL